MKKFALVFALTFLGVGLLSETAFAFMPMTGADLFIDQEINDDVYAAGNNVVISKKVTGDVTGVGSALILNSDIDGDLNFGAGQVTVNGNVKDDVRLAAGNITVNGDVFGDLIVMGGNIILTPEAYVKGDLFVAGGVVTLNGVIDGNVTGFVQVVSFGSEIKGNVKVTVNEMLNLSDKAHIYGDFKYIGIKNMNVPDEQVDGEISFNKLQFAAGERGDGNVFTKKFSGPRIIFKIIVFVSLFILGMLLILLVPNEVIGLYEKINNNFWQSLLVGFLAILIIIAGAIFLLVTVIGFPLFAILSALFLIMYYLSRVFAAIWLGMLVFRYKKAGEIRKGKILGMFAIGLFLLTLVSFVPYLGSLGRTFVFLVALGGFLMRRWEMLKLLRKEKFI